MVIRPNHTLIFFIIACNCKYVTEIIIIIIIIIQDDRKVTQPILTYLLMDAIQYNSTGLIKTISL
jgi:hypothetical protein